MSVIYTGPYADQIGQHEGYEAQVLRDGSLSGTRTKPFVGYVAVCECGWQGETRYPPTEEGADEALAEWRSKHLRPLITAAHLGWPDWAERVAARATTIAGHVGDGRFDTAVLVLERLAEDVQTWARSARALADGEDMSVDLGLDDSTTGGAR